MSADRYVVTWAWTLECNHHQWWKRADAVMTIYTHAAWSARLGPDRPSPCSANSSVVCYCYYYSLGLLTNVLKERCIVAPSSGGSPRQSTQFCCVARIFSDSIVCVCVCVCVEGRGGGVYVCHVYSLTYLMHGVAAACDMSCESALFVRQ